MENPKANQNQNVKLDLIVKSVYTLDKNKVDGIRDFKDKNNYLYKDGSVLPVMCPFMTSVSFNPHTRQPALLPYSCGTFCQHFHIAPETKKVPAADGKPEATVPTGRIKVGLSCGSSGVWHLIEGLTLGETQSAPSVPTTNPSETHLKVEGKDEK